MLKTCESFNQAVFTNVILIICRVKYGLNMWLIHSCVYVAENKTVIFMNAGLPFCKRGHKGEPTVKCICINALCLSEQNTTLAASLHI